MIAPQLPGVVVAQKGSREHFLAARGLLRQGMLRKLVVDWYMPANPMLRFAVSQLGRRGASMLGAQCAEIPRALVRSLPAVGVRGKCAERSAARRGAKYAGFVETDSAFARAVGRLDLPEHEVFFGYSYASLEALAAEKQRGKFLVLDQIDPGPVEFRLVAEEMTRRPELAGPPPEFPQAYFDRVRSEWKLADVILVNSEWTRDAIVAEGAAASRVEILPLAYEAEQGARTLPEAAAKSASAQNLKVLWLGQVNVRKGIHYLIEAARRLANEPVEFLIAGPVGIRPEVVAAAPPNMKWLGPIPRTQAAELYRQADVFALPTLSDGFAITQLEALAHGLPVIATPNCGRVVEADRTGWIVPPRNSTILAEVVQSCIRDRKRVRSMAVECRAEAQKYSVTAYGERLAEIITRRMPPLPA